MLLIFASKCKRFSQESFKTPITSGNSFAPKLTHIYNRKIGLKFKGNFLMQDNMSCTHRKVVNLFIFL